MNRIVWREDHSEKVQKQSKTLLKQQGRNWTDTPFSEWEEMAPEMPFTEVPSEYPMWLLWWLSFMIILAWPQRYLYIQMDSSQVILTIIQRKLMSYNSLWKFYAFAPKLFFFFFSQLILIWNKPSGKSAVFRISQNHIMRQFFCLPGLFSTKAFGCLMN